LTEKNISILAVPVLYRHLQKLEDAEHLHKKTHGEYAVKSKAHIRDCVQLGSHPLPKMRLYSLLFLAIF
jgi:hypothetical protein